MQKVIKLKLKWIAIFAFIFPDSDKELQMEVTEWLRERGWEH